MTNEDKELAETQKRSKTTRGRLGERFADRRTFMAVTGTTALTTSVAGCLDLGSASDDGELTIGHLAPLENDQGIGSDRSAKLAIDQINEDGGIMDRDVDIVSGNTRGRPEPAQNEASRMVQEDDVDVIIGTFSSEATQGILDMIAEFDVPFIITGSAAPSSITEFIGQDYEQYKNTFRTGPINSNFQAEAMGDYAEYLSDHHGWNSFGFLADNAAWTEPFSNNLPDELESRGFDVVHEDRLSIEIDDFTPVMDDLAEAEPDAVFRFFAHIIGGAMLGQWHQRQLPFGIEGIHVASMTPDFYELSEGAATYETTSQSGAAGTTDITENTIPFVEDYQAYTEDDDEAPTLPMYMGFNTYDAVNIYKEAVERAGTADYENDLDAIVDAMLETDHTGTAGQISIYGPDAEYPHDAVETRDDGGTIQNFPITQWQPEGALECVYPEIYRTADHVAPHWMG